MAESPYMTSAESATYVKATLKAFDHWVTREGIPCVRRGRIRLFRRETLDRAMQVAAMRPRKHRKVA